MGYFEKTFILSGIFGDLQTGYYLMKLNYMGVSNIEKTTLESMFSGKDLQILSDEIDLVNEGKFSHNLFFSSLEEIKLNFEDIKITLKSANSNEYKSKICELQIINSSLP